MADLLGNTVSAPGPNFNSNASTGWSTNVGDVDLPNQTHGGHHTPLSAVVGGGPSATITAGVVANEWLGAETLDSPGVLWFERFYFLPSAIDVGNILTTVVQAIEIYNSNRKTSRSMTAADANAGAGVTLEDVPLLPATINAQTGLVMSGVISTEGPPSIDGTYDFTVDSVDFTIPVTGNRVIMFSYEPESPIRELLEFKTDVLQSADGSEQRVNVRKNPRQAFEMIVRIDDPTSRRKMNTLLTGWQDRVFGVPIWWETRLLGADIATDDTTITVDTASGDFRVGSLAIVWQDAETFDALEIASFNASSITFSSPLTQDFTAGQALVMPLRTAYTEPSIAQQSHPVAVQDTRLKFRVLDNDADIASTAAWSTHNSKVMLDDPNLLQGGIHPTTNIKKIEHIDNTLGNELQFSPWTTPHPRFRKRFLCQDTEQVWDVRQLVHALRGSQTSFYLPTFYPDILVTGILTASSFLMDIENIGYTDFINGQEPFKSLWIELVDGTILTRQVTGAEIIDSDTERLTVDIAWASEVLPAEIARVSYLQFVRIDGDQVLLEHQFAGDATVSMDVIGVQQ